MKCPACGNDELQEHHRFCCNCGCSLAGVRSAGETLAGSTPDSTQRPPSNTADQRATTSNSDTSVRNENSFASEEHPHDANQRPESDKSSRVDSEKHESKKDGFVVGSQDDRCTSEDVTTGSRPISNLNSDLQQVSPNTGIDAKAPDRLDEVGLTTIQYNGEDVKKEQTGLQEDVKKEQTGLQEDVKNEQTGLQKFVKKEQTGLQENVRKEQTGLQEVAKKEQTGLQEDVKKEQTGLQEVAKKEQTGLQEVVKKEQTGLQEDVKNEQTGLQEVVKKEQTGLQEVAKKEQTGLQEDVKKEQTGLQEDVKNEQTGLQEDVKEEQTGLQEDVKKEQTGLQEDVKKEQTGLQEDVKKEQTGLQEDVKKEQTDLQEDVKKEQTDLQEDVKKKQTGQEDAKNEQTGLQEDVKKELTGLQEDVKKELTGLQEDVKKEQTGREDVKKEQTGLQEDVKKEQTGLQEVVKKEQTGLQEDVKKEQTGLQEDVKKELTGLQEDVKKEQTGLQEDVKKEQTGLQEDVKKEQTGLQEDVKKEQTGLQEDVKKEQTGREDVKKEQTGQQEDVKKEQTGLQEVAKKEQTGLQEDVKKEQTGLQEDVKKELTGLQEDVKKEQTALQEDVKKEQTGLQEDVKKEQTGREDVKKEQTGQQEDVKKEQTGLQEVAKKEQTGLQEDVKKEQTGLQEDVKKEQTGREDTKEEKKGQEDVKKAQMGQEHVNEKQTGLEDAKEKQTGQVDTKGKQAGKEDAKKNQKDQEHAEEKHTDQEDAKGNQSGQEDVKNKLTSQKDAKERQTGKDDAKEQTIQENAKEKQTDQEDGKERAGQEDTKKKQKGQEDTTKEQKGEDDAKEKQIDPENTKTERTDQEGAKKGQKDQFGFVTVVFHALLTPTFQFNPKQGDRLYIRGGLPFSWREQNQLTVHVVRDVFNGYMELEGKIKITLKQASGRIAYKYVVVRPQGFYNPPKNFWECLIGFKPRVNGHVNRCLHIREDSLKDGATWHQYDDALFSEPGLWESICSHFPLLRTVRLDPAEGRRMAMLVMLPDWDRISCDQGAISGSSALTIINDIVYCLSKPEVENGGYFFDRILTNFNFREVLYEYLSPRLNLNTQIQQTQATEDVQVKRLVTSVIIASLSVRHEMTFLTEIELRNLLENLTMQGNVEIQGLIKHFPKEYHQRTLTDFMQRLCNYVIEHRFGMVYWLFAVPLLHFLSKSSSPFGQKELTPAPSSVKDDLWWGTEDLNLRRAREGASALRKSPALLLNQLMPMFELDPLFERTFLLALPIGDISKVLKKRKFSLHEVCWTLNRVVVDRHTPFLNDDEWDCLEDCVKEMNDDAEKYDRVLSISQWEEMISLAKAASQLLQHLLKQYQLAIQKRSVLFCGVLALLGKSLLLAKRGSSMFQSESKPFAERPEEGMNMFKEAFVCLRESLKKQFGRTLLDASEEFQFWSHLLLVNFEDKEMQQYFQTGIKELLQSRITEVDHRHVVELFCTLDLSTYHQDVGDCVMSAAFKAIEYLLKSENKDEHVATLSSRFDSAKLTHWQASGVSKLFGLLLERHWPGGRDRAGNTSQIEILRHIFSWKPMAQYFEYFSHSQGGVVLPDDSMVILSSASSLLEDVGRRLKNAEIDVKTLRIVQKNREEFLKLHYLLSEVDESQSSNDVQTAENKLSEAGEKQKGARTMELFLEMRIEELKAFEKERDAVFFFVEQCSVIKSVEIDLNEINVKLKKDLDSCRLHELCHKRTTSEEPIVKFFEMSQNNRRMIQSFHLVRSSLLFLSFWQKCVQKAAELCRDEYGLTEVLNIDKVFESLWKPSIQRWRGMWERILSGEISLKEVEDRFGRFRNNSESLDAEIEVVLKFFRDEEDIDGDLRRAVAQIKQFQKLTECEDAAAAILDFQQAMKLKGDFQVLDDFRDQMNEDFRRRPLGSIDDDVLEMGKALERLTRPMIDCLRTVIDCKEYIFWLREEVQGREEVKTLVDLAMMSAGESDIETDRVSCLHTTALSFAPFIFDLDKCAGLNDLMAICEGVSEEIEENGNLPEKLRDISRHLEWLKGVKDAHAMSSLKLAQAINERGVYCIGQSENVTSTTPSSDKKSIDSVISLLLLPTTADGEQKVFSLEKLQELQSKLALISGKGSQGQDDVEKFSQLLQGVCQLGKAYVSLCEIGDVSHLDWREEYKCKSKVGHNVIVEIQSKSKEFEERFKACKEHINVMRMKYHELNYFTIQQLVFLRKQLAGLKHSSTMSLLNLQVYALLEKVLPGLHHSSLQDTLLDAGILLSHLNQDVYSEDVGSSNTCDLMSLTSAERDGRCTDDQQIVEKYEQLLNNLEKLNYFEPERLAVAALVSNSESTEVECVLWCVNNNANGDLIDELYDRAKGDPMFCGIVKQVAESDEESLQSSEDLEEGHKSSTEGSDNEELDGSIPEEITLDETKGGIYLSLDEIGVFLSRLASNGGGDVRRRFPSFLKKGRPNLILAPKEYIFASVLGLYMDEGAQCLPNSEEVLICTPETTSEEVELLWRRALENDEGKLHCLVNGDLLDYDVSQKAVDCLHTLMQDYPSNEDLALVVLCSSENEERAHIVTSLEQFKVEGIPRYSRPDELRRYLQRQFKSPHQRPGSYRDQHVIWSAAADVARAENLNVRVVKSEHPGVGKSLVVQRLAEQVSNLPNNLQIKEIIESQSEEPPPLCVTIPFHDKNARITDVVSSFLPHALSSEVPLSRIFHLDRSSTVTPEFETLLFNLLILGELTDDRGHVWRRNPYDLYILEITDPAPKGAHETTKTCKFHELLPSINCFRPSDSLFLLRRKGEVQTNSSPLFDEEELQNEPVQRVWQYLQLFNEDPQLIQELEFDPGSARCDSPAECLETLIRNCGVRNPSWSELRYFVNFLNYQLRDCENSAYCDASMTDDTLEGFRSFVVAFMIIMSKDFSMRSLEESDSLLNEQQAAGVHDEERDIAPFQLRRQWEKSPHPYIFFNPDHTTMTFLGFRVDPDGNLLVLDPRTGQIIQERLMSRHLRTGLHVQGVDLNNSFESYSKAEKIGLLSSVMGLEFGYDPDESYELTGDNVKKILAIHMRFRCNIPVVIMGETGCGKTRLIRYLCGLQTEGQWKDLKNMLLMKIHGGTTYKDIERNVLHAEAMALQNEQHKEHVDTVLFFDEANTTDALGMIKEVMVDRRCNGRPLSDRVKFIVACNPYRRHSKEMIRKLESAGLGYHVRADETEERLGQIPLRHLVYRVHAIPGSMRSLVWDFGQLSPEVEELYTRQIVGRYVQQKRLPGGEELVIAIATVLAASQQFMRNKEDECSFVSLRDVKRAMEVMVWFYENFEKFSALIQDEDNDEGKESDDRKQDMDEFEEELSIFKPEHAAFKDEDRPVKKQQPTFAEDRPILKREPRSLITNIEELPTFEKERSSQVFRPARKVHFKEQPTLETERAAPKLNLPTFEERHALKEERPTLQKVRIPFKDERPALPRGVGYAQQAEMYLPELEELDFEPRLVEELQGDAMQGNLSDVIDPVTWSLILALGVCYQARLRDRNEYRETVAKSFRHPCRLPGGAARIEREISRCQQALMAQLELGPNIARNTALSENVFMMVVCIELRIPLFVVGKPGSSKSLAKTVVADNMQGDNSKSNLFKTFKQIQLVSYQCSPQSTPEGILATFRQCSELQKGKNTERTSDRFASVVVLDEVGLAEDSPKMPLKALHPLLEDEDQNDDEIIQTEDSFTRVAFIGLSNWALDPAKMNRGIMLCRNEPDDDELEATARGICGGDEDVMTLIEPLISPLVRGYTELYNKQKHLQKLQDGKKDEFFGLRDFYSLLKMVVHIAKEQRRRPNWDELERAIKRNFSGLLEEDFNPVQILMRNLGFPPEYFQVEEDHQGEDSLNLIRESLKRKGGMGEGRYLLIMTENFAALPRVKQLLIEEDSEEPYVIFGSGFPKDQLFTQVCRNINRVKICMETGRTVILLNLENLYESLYDALNQYYVTFGGEKYVDLGLGNNRVKCRVHKDFRLIVIAEKDVVYNKFPIPLINRLEKHFLVMSSGLTEPQKHLTRRLKEWVDDFAEVFQPAHERPKRTFKTGDAFIGYQEDSVSAVVLQVCAELRDDGSVLSSDEDRQSWEDNVLRCCQERLLQCATPDSVTRLHKSRLSSQAGDLWTTYFREQEHSSLANFLDKALNDAKLRATDNTKTAMRVQISTHSRLLSDRDIPNIAAAVELPEGCVKCVSLKQFQTEQQFCNCIGRDFWARLGGRESLLIVQCDSADQSLGLLACARHLLVEECREMEKELDPDSTGPSHILMIVQLSRVAGGCSDFVGVQLDDWKSIHIDELCPPSEEMPPIEALMGRSVSKIFESALQKEESALTVCQVLASCVQEAASRIEDDESTLGRATRRIELLVKLLSKNTTSDDDRFEMVLAKRLCELLQEKDQRAVNEGNEWLQSEAMSRTVHETGTFKKALWRRFQSVVAPILAEVIAYVDRDGNLELAASEDDWVFNLWLRIFGDSSLSELSYEFFHEGDVPVVRNKVPVSKSGYRSHAFQCRFPFSWILKERIDELYREARSIAANSHESVTECLRRLLNNSEVKSIVSEAIDEGGQEAVVACYLYDFVHMVYKPHDEDEIEVVQKAITAAAKEIHNSVQTPGESFAMDFALVHVAHSRIQQRLNCLSLLLQAKPDIMPDLRNRFSWDENEMTVDAMALQMCLERMEPCAEDVEDTSRRQTWCDQVLSVKVPVEETISKSSTGDSPRVGEKTELIITQCRCMWQRLSAVRMFIEHACPSQMELDPQDVQNILRLWKALGDRTDFSKAESLITVERFLVSCSEDSIQRLQEDKPEDHQAFLHRCNAFFMDIVSVFCFGEDVRFLDPGVFEMLMRFVTGKHSTHETREFSPFPEFGADSSPVVRSFLLQQLVNSSDETAKKHLERFLYEAQGLSSEVPHILNVCLLAVQCMENSLASTLAKNANLELQISIGIITKLCQDALQILTKDFSSSDELQVESLDAIAKARYVLGIVAEFMYLSCVSDDEKWKRHEICASLELLFVKVKALCTSSDHRSPALYLLKQLVKRFGGHSISAVSQNEELSWIVPAEFLQREGDGMNLDRFLVYGELYRKVRDCLARAILSENTDELIATLEALREIPGHARDIVVLLALYREVAVAQNQLLHQNKYVPIKDVVLKRGRFLSTNARHFAKDLLKDSHGLGSPFFLGVQETQSGIVQALPEILFHVATVLRCTEFDEMLEPLRRIMLSPGHVMGSFLPTMPEDSFSEVSLSMSEGGNWYECPAGHRYFVGDCGRPDQTRDCPSCESGVEIGGEKHNLIRTNRLATRQDRSNTGHILGAPQRTIAERDLSPANVSLLRVILHSAMLVGSYQQPEVISQLMQPQIQAEDVCGFLWEHLINDVRNVSTSLERSEDEVLLMIHHVLSEIMSRSTARGLDFSEKWSTKTGRKEWENEFVKVFARHVCTNLEERLRSFYSLSVNDRRLGNDPLMREIYEVDTPPPTRTAADIHPGHAAFWKYRTRVTVEHVIRQFQDVKSNRASCKVLEKFLAEEQSLRAVRYLHDILALQRILTDRFHRRIDRDRANQIKIRELLQEFPRGQKENITKLFRSFSAAWEQVRLQLSSQGRFAPTKEQCSLPIDQNSTVSVLLPTDDGAGVCCKGLLFFLVNKHNELVQAYSNSVNSNGNAARKAGNIPLSEVSISQLVAYDSEKDLLPVMLANCSYSLEVGKETQLQYNWEALEKQIVDRFIRGRPLVDFEVDNFLFREDARDDFAFDRLRSKIPQESIPGPIRTQILSELKDLRNVCDLLSTLEMAIGFLSTAGGDPEMKIHDYFKTILLITDGKSNLKSKKAQQSCSLNHILDLWCTLAIARAKLLIDNRQDPFEKVPEVFKTEMTRHITTHFSAALKKEVNIELFLSKVIEVISLWLDHEDEQTGEMGLGEYLSTYSDDYPDADKIPEDVCVKHVIQAWQLALENRERDQGRRRSMIS